MKFTSTITRLRVLAQLAEAIGADAEARHYRRKIKLLEECAAD